MTIPTEASHLILVEASVARPTSPYTNRMCIKIMTNNYNTGIRMHPFLLLACTVHVLLCKMLTALLNVAVDFVDCYSQQK